MSESNGCLKSPSNNKVMRESDDCNTSPALSHHVVAIYKVSIIPKPNSFHLCNSNDTLMLCTWPTLNTNNQFNPDRSLSLSQ